MGGLRFERPLWANMLARIQRGSDLVYYFISQTEFIKIQSQTRIIENNVVLVLLFKHSYTISHPLFHYYSLFCLFPHSGSGIIVVAHHGCNLCKVDTLLKDTVPFGVISRGHKGDCRVVHTFNNL